MVTLRRAVIRNINFTSEDILKEGCRLLILEVNFTGFQIQKPYHRNAIIYTDIEKNM